MQISLEWYFQHILPIKASSEQLFHSPCFWSMWVFFWCELTVFLLTFFHMSWFSFMNIPQVESYVCHCGKSPYKNRIHFLYVTHIISLNGHYRSSFLWLVGKLNVLEIRITLLSSKPPKQFFFKKKPWKNLLYFLQKLTQNVLFE